MYALGEVSPEEREQVERMVATHAAVKDELREVEKALELYAGENAVSTSEQHRNKVLNSILTNFADDSTFDKPTLNKVVALPPRKMNIYKYAFAASLALLVGSLMALYNVYDKLEQSNGQLLALQSQNTKLSQVINHQHDQLDVFRDPSFKLLKLTSTGKVPLAQLTVAWSPVKRKVMINLADMKLPANDHNHQYQLWAMVNGKPVDLGVFDKTPTDTSDMKLMKPVALASAFAVTLEPRGGSVNPTMSEMMVIGQF